MSRDLVDGDETYGPEEKRQRLRKTLKAAFDMRPMPQMDIPTMRSEFRSVRRPKAAKRKATTPT